jgi:hypothetical protein
MNFLLSCPEVTGLAWWVARMVAALLFAPVVVTYCLDFQEGGGYINEYTKQTSETKE